MKDQNNTQVVQSPNDGKVINPELISLLDETQEVTSIYPAQDFKDGKLWYSFQNSSGKFLFNSDAKHFSFSGLQTHHYELKSEPTQYDLKSEFIRHFLKKYTVSHEEGYEKGIFIAYQLYKAIKQYLLDYIVFPSPLVPEVVTCWIIGSYVFTIFNYYPYIHIQAEKGSGKSLLMEVMREIAFNGEKVDSITSSVLFREIENNRPTFFLDEAERYRKQDNELYSDLMQIFNSGFKHDGKVMRSTKIDGKDWTPKEYSVFSPKCFAGINNIHDVLKDRTIPIRLLRKKAGDQVKRFRLDENLKRHIYKIKQLNYGFGLRYVKTIQEIYNDGCLEDEIPVELSDREKDIWEPLFTIGKIIDKELDLRDEPPIVLESLKDYSILTSNKRKEEDLENNDTVKIVNILLEIIESSNFAVNTNNNRLKFSRNALWNIFDKNYKEQFPEIDTRTKMVQAINRSLDILPEKLTSSSNDLDSDKWYVIPGGFLEDMRERYM